MKNAFNFFGIIAMAVVIVFSMASCGDSPNDGEEPDLTVPDVSQLPAFPAGSNPAKSKADAEKVLGDLKASLALQKIDEVISDYIWDYVDEELDGDWDGNFSFNNQTITGENLKVSASVTGSSSETGGFKAMSELYDSYYQEESINWVDYQTERDKIQFAVNDRSKGSEQYWSKGEVTAAKTINGVTIANGSTFEEIEEYPYDYTVVKAGSISTALFNRSGSEKGQIAIGCTVTTTSGSIKIVLGITGDYSGSGKNVHYEWDDDDNYTETEKCSGSLKIYGDNNALLIEKPVNDWDDFNDVLVMIGYREDW